MVTFVKTNDGGGLFAEGSRYYINFYGVFAYSENFVRRYLLKNYNQVSVLWMNRFETSGDRLPYLKIDELTPEEYAELYARVTLIGRIILTVVFGLFGLICCVGCTIVACSGLRNLKDQIFDAMRNGAAAVKEVQKKEFGQKDNEDQPTGTQ